MAFDQDKHALHPVTGYQIDKETGRMIGLESAPISAPVEIGDYPKWVAVHESHIVRKQMEGAPDHVSVPSWPEFHVNRLSGQVTVLVMNEDEEKEAMANVSAHVEGPAAPEFHPEES